MATLYQQTKELFEFAESDVKRIGTGIHQIDKVIRGIVPGEVCTVLGSSFSGKSIFGQNIIYNNREYPSIFFSLEMPASQALIRLYAMWSGENAVNVQQNIENGNPPADMWSMLEEFRYHRIVDEPSLSTQDMSLHVEEYVDDFGRRPEFVVVDYMELVGGTAVNAEGVQGVDAQATMLKDWAKHENMRVFVLHQTNRSQPEWEPPHKNSARYGGYTQADYVIGLWRPHKEPGLDYFQALALNSMISANVIKNRGFFEELTRADIPIWPSLRLGEQEVRSEFRHEPSSAGSETEEGNLPEPFADPSGL